MASRYQLTANSALQTQRLQFAQKLHATLDVFAGIYEY